MAVSSPEVVGGLVKGSFHERWRPVGSGKNERREMELTRTDDPLRAGERAWELQGEMDQERVLEVGMATS